MLLTGRAGDARNPFQVLHDQTLRLAKCGCTPREIAARPGAVR